MLLGHAGFPSIDRVSVFRGGAGTGKSFSAARAGRRQIRDGGRGVVVLAPQRQQVLDMERDGFASPTTVASFLQKKELKEGTGGDGGRGRARSGANRCWNCSAWWWSAMRG